MQIGRSPQERLAYRKAQKNVRMELLEKSKKEDSKAHKSDYKSDYYRSVNESGVRIVISQEAKDFLRDKYIDDVLESGEPLRGISYDDYFWYYKDKHGYIMTDQIQQEYRQALKGDNASLREREWRTNPDYRIPQRLWDHPLIAAEREAVLEKIRNDEELEEWEKNLLSTFSDVTEGDRIVYDARMTQRTHRLEKDITNALSEAGIALSPDDELRFEVWGSEMKVTGNLDDETLQTISETLNQYARTMGVIYLNKHPMSYDGEAELQQLEYAADYLKDTGVTVLDISLDENGNIVGLPDELDKFIKENAGKSDIIDKGNGNFEWDNVVRKAKNMRDAFKSAIKTVKNRKYDYFRSKVGVLTFKNGTLSC